MAKRLARWGGIVLSVVLLAPPVHAWPPFWLWWRIQTLAGTVTAVDAANKTLTVETTARWFPSTVTFTVDPSAVIVRHYSTPLSGLRPGDEVEVAGLPLAIKAEKLRASTPPVTQAPAVGTSETASATSEATVPALKAHARAVGTVKSVDTEKRQVIVSLADGTEVTVTVPADLKVQRRDIVSLADVKVRDTVHARVVLSWTGRATAVSLEVFEPEPTPGEGSAPSEGTPGGQTETGGTAQ
ncbi:MAG: hypothetical protein ACUVRO_04370 [Armatimonadota bacterium]